MDLANILNGVTAEESKEKAKFIPADKYNVVIEKITEKKNETGWSALNFQLRVFGERFNNYVLFDLVTTAHASSKEAVEIGLKRLKKISELTGETDTKAMLGKKLHAAVGVVDDKYKIDKGEDGAQKNIIWGYGELLVADNTTIGNIGTNASMSTEEIPF